MTAGKFFVPLLQNDLAHNYVELLVWKKLLRDNTANDAEIEAAESGINRHISKFTILRDDSPVMSIEVGPGKYKTAMLLLYLASRHNSSSFRMDEESRLVVRLYYSAELIEDALSNPETVHTSLRALLLPGNVQINCLA